MLTITEEQKNQMRRERMIEKLDVAFSRDIPNFSALDDSDRRYFISEAITIANALGFETEQGAASYALAIWWLGIDFENKSKDLQELLESNYPEVRRVHAMNEWVNAVIGDPENIAAADQVMRQALEQTEAWGAED